MLAIPGKACGECSFCCKVLEITELTKSAGKLCEHCLSSGSGGCGIYASRPQVCHDYECLWKGDRHMSPRLRPDRTGTILMEDPDSDEYRAVCDPEKPFAWLTPIVFKHLVAMAKAGGLSSPRRVEILANSRQWAMGSLRLNRCQTRFRMRSNKEIPKLTLPPRKSLYKARFAASAGG